MARCLQCNKFMLFRSSSGYCSSCEAFIQQKKAHEEKAKEAVKASSVNKSPVIKKEEVAKSTQANKVIGKSYLCANTDQIISADLVPPVFNMSDIVHEGQGYYLLKNENITKALRDILSINYYIVKATELCPGFPDTPIDANNIGFEKTNSMRRDYCTITFAPLTPSGKPPKYPVRLLFYQSFGFRGEIHYDKDGKIGKARIIELPYELNLSASKGSLQVHNIYKTDMNEGKKEKIYG